jgi:hypothetical protein
MAAFNVAAGTFLYVNIGYSISSMPVIAVMAWFGVLIATWRHLSSLDSSAQYTKIPLKLTILSSNRKNFEDKKSPAIEEDAHSSEEENRWAVGFNRRKRSMIVGSP